MCSSMSLVTNSLRSLTATWPAAAIFPPMISANSVLFRLNQFIDVAIRRSLITFYRVAILARQHEIPDAIL